MKINATTIDNQTITPTVPNFGINIIPNGIITIKRKEIPAAVFNRLPFPLLVILPPPERKDYTVSIRTEGHHLRRRYHSPAERPQRRR